MGNGTPFQGEANGVGPGRVFMLISDVHSESKLGPKRRRTLSAETLYFRAIRWCDGPFRRCPTRQLGVASFWISIQLLGVETVDPILSINHVKVTECNEGGQQSALTLSRRLNAATMPSYHHLVDRAIQCRLHLVLDRRPFTGAVQGDLFAQSASLSLSAAHCVSGTDHCAPS